jgi:hypothetical protein
MVPCCIHGEDTLVLLKYGWLVSPELHVIYNSHSAVHISPCVEALCGPLHRVVWRVFVTRHNTDRQTQNTATIWVPSGFVEAGGNLENTCTPNLKYGQCVRKNLIKLLVWDGRVNAIMRRAAFVPFNKQPCEISSFHGGEYEVQNRLLGCTAV